MGGRRSKEIGQAYLSEIGLCPRKRIEAEEAQQPFETGPRCGKWQRESHRRPVKLRTTQNIPEPAGGALYIQLCIVRRKALGLG